MEFCRRENVRVVIRGVRVYSDFEYEFQLAAANRFAGPGVDMVFFMSGSSTAFQGMRAG